MSKRQQLRHFYARPWADKWLFIQAYLGLGLAYVAIHTLPFRWLSPWLGQPMAESVRQVSPEHVRLIRRVAWAVKRASALTPWPSVCFPQAVTAKMLLRQRGLSSTLYLGAAFNDARDLTAHAWLRCGPLYVTGGPGHRQFRVVASFAEEG